jgi:hypothetical protein
LDCALPDRDAAARRSASLPVDPRDELAGCAWVAFRNVCKNIVKVGERTAFEAELHTLR